MVFAFVGQVVYEDGMDERVEEANLAKAIVGLLVGIVVATNLLPTIFNQTTTLEADANDDLDASEEGLIGVWPIIIIVGVMMAIIGIML